MFTFVLALLGNLQPSEIDLQSITSRRDVARAFPRFLYNISKISRSRISKTGHVSERLLLSQLSLIKMFFFFFF